jgi:hypothetical protein
MRLYSYDNGTNRQVYVMLLCYLLSLSKPCCSVPIVFFQAGFDYLKTTEMMAANESYVAAYCRLIAVEIKQILLHKPQISNNQA